MSIGSIHPFERFLVPATAAAAFAPEALYQHMLDVEAALARAQAAEGLIPMASASAIAAACRASLYDLDRLAAASSRAGSVAIPLVDALRTAVAREHPEAARHVHLGSTSQDVSDTALALATRHSLAALDGQLALLVEALCVLADAHDATPVLARTLMQPAAVTSFGLKCVNWAAPLARSRERLREAAARALALQLGGAVGTLAAFGDKGPAVARRVAAELGLALPPAPWHTQRDDWVRLGLEAAVLTASLGKVATDLALMAQAEVGELAEPAVPGRGASSAMPHKRNPVSALLALAAADRAPAHAATLLATLSRQQHERGLGSWQAECAEWPGLFSGAHAAALALAEALVGLRVDAPRMRANIEALRGSGNAELQAAFDLGDAARAAQQARERTAVLRAAARRADAAAATPVRVREIDHVVLRVRDLDRMIAFYAGVLGCSVERRQDEIGLVQLRAGRSLIDLVNVDGTLGRTGGAAPGPEGRNVDHICLRVESFDEAALRAHLAAHGVVAADTASRYGAEGDGPSIYLHDPEGNQLELKGPPA